MIDLHCHILPGLDDGAKDMDETVAMARQAETDGIEVVCATPHIRPDHEVGPAELEVLVALANARLEEEAVPVRIATGGELAAEMVDRLDDATLRLVSLGAGGRWLLLEPRPGPLDATLVRDVDTLRKRGFSCIIAHPERHAAADFTDRVAELVEHGALIQATAAYVADGPASPTLLELARDGLLHLLGSDSHSPTIGRPVNLSSAVARLAEIGPLRPHLNWIASDAPAAILRGEQISPPFGPG
jgi:protein-tyrosine phosphatase